jgi:DNA-binding transcriptional LysR family regulator
MCQMNVQQLKIFVEIMQGRSLSDIAEEMGIKQPTVSFHLAKLEETLGTPLFQKVHRTFRPTSAAELLQPYAKRIVYLMEEAHSLMEEHRGQGRGRLRLGASYTPATYFLPPYLADFQEKHPQVLLTLTVKKAGAILDMLRSFQIDAGVISLPAVSEEGVTVLPLLEDELKLLLPPTHPLALLPQVELEDLREEHFLVHEAGSTSQLLAEQWASDVGLSMKIKMELGAIETIKEAIKNHMGIGILPKRSVLREVQSGDLIMRDLPHYVNRRHICLVYRQEDVLAPTVRAFIGYIQTMFSLQSSVQLHNES